MKILTLLLATCVVLPSFDLYARGGGGGGGFRGGGDGGGEFRGGGGDFREGGGDFREGGGDFREGGGDFREGGGDFGDDEGGGRRDEDGWEGDGVNVDREGAGDYQVEDGRGDANVDVQRDGDGLDNVNVQTGSGRDYDASVAGPDGYRAGYVWRDGGYAAVDCAPWAAYAVPFGAWAGWSIVTQPDYLQYPVYATYPIETAVQVALLNLGLYSGTVDGNAASCSEAIEQYQEQNNLPVTGTITPALLSALGIQATGAE
jgi:hypothetical protein